MSITIYLHIWSTTYKKLARQMVVTCLPGTTPLIQVTGQAFGWAAYQVLAICTTCKIWDTIKCLLLLQESMIAYCKITNRYLRDSLFGHLRYHTAAQRLGYLCCIVSKLDCTRDKWVGEQASQWVREWVGGWGFTLAIIIQTLKQNSHQTGNTIYRSQLKEHNETEKNSK